MTHNFVFTLFVYTLAASAIPSLVWNVAWRKRECRMRRLISTLRKRLSSERRRTRSVEQQFNDVLARYVRSLRRAVYYRHMSKHYKKQRGESRALLVSTERQLADERERSSIRSFLQDLFNRFVPFPAHAG
jgi:type II secretory pathway pseudopilin PulG